jgi:hypothetical protein
MTNNIELSKTRDFGDIISDTFLFIRENFASLLKCFFIFCGFFMVALIVIASFQQAKLIDVVNSNEYGASNPFGKLSQFFGLQYFFTILFSLLNYTAITVTILSYMAVYKSKGNMPPTPEEVWGYIKFYFFKTFGSMILITILFVIALVCCIIPGIWLYPILSLIFPIMIFENTSFGYAFGQSFRLIKDNWWATFGALFVIMLILYVLSVIVIMPVSLIAMGSMFLHASKGTHPSATALIATTTITTLCHVFYILPIVALALCYFNLTELKDSTGLMDRINQLGSNETNTDLPAEEY